MNDRLRIYVRGLQHPTLDDSKLLELMAELPSDSVVVLEDVDAAFHERRHGDGASSTITFSGLLNAIDGVAAQVCCSHIIDLTSTSNLRRLPSNEGKNVDVLTLSVCAGNTDCIILHTGRALTMPYNEPCGKARPRSDPAWKD